MGNVLILQNAPLFTGGTFEEELKRREISFEYHKAYENGPPSPEAAARYSGFIVLGGPLALRVTEGDRPAFVDQEIFFLRSCLEAHKPVFAVSQGAAILAQAQGAWAKKEESPEIGWATAEIYPDYSRNSVIYSKVEEKKFPAFLWTQTTHGFPPRGYWYLTTPHCRYLSSGIHGNCYLFNFHPEVTPELVNSWLKEYGKDLPNAELAEEIRRQTQEHFEVTKAFSRKIIHAFESFLK